MGRCSQRGRWWQLPGAVGREAGEADILEGCHHSSPSLWVGPCGLQEERRYPCGEGRGRVAGAMAEGEEGEGGASADRSRGGQRRTPGRSFTPRLLSWWASGRRALSPAPSTSPRIQGERASALPRGVEAQRLARLRGPSESSGQLLPGPPSCGLCHTRSLSTCSEHPLCGWSGYRDTDLSPRAAMGHLCPQRDASPPEKLRTPPVSARPPASSIRI